MAFELNTAGSVIGYIGNGRIDVAGVVRLFNHLLSLSVPVRRSRPDHVHTAIVAPHLLRRRGSVRPP
jgi:hypothetical protein